MKKGTSHDNPLTTESKRIKLIHQTVYDALDRFGEIIHGQMLDRIDYGNDEHIVEEYNQDGKLVRRAYLNTDDSVSGEYNFIYSKNLLIEEGYTKINREYNGCSHKIIHTYNTDGMILETVRISEQKIWDFKKIYKYSNEGNLIEINEYSAQGILRQKVKQHYDQNNLLSIKETYASNGHLSERGKYNYDGHFLKTHDIYFFRQGYSGDRTDLESYTYDLNGNLLNYKDRGRYENYFYDMSNLLIKKTIQAKNEVLTYEYKKDENDNWIKKIHFRNEIPFAITIREIEYF